MDEDIDDDDAEDKGKGAAASMSEEISEILLEGNALYRLQVNGGPCCCTVHCYLYLMRMDP